MNDPYFTAAELRAAYPELANAQKYTDVKLELARVFAEQWFEAAAHVAYVRRTATETLSGTCLLYTSPSPRDRTRSRMPSSA